MNIVLDGNLYKLWSQCSDMIWDREKFCEPDTKNVHQLTETDQTVRSNRVKEGYEHQGTGMFFREEEGELRVDTGNQKVWVLLPVPIWVKKMKKMKEMQEEGSSGRTRFQLD